MIARQHPQRLTPPAPYGSLLKRLERLAAVVRLENAQRDPGYLHMLRQCPCIRCGLDPAGEVHHVRLSSAAYGKRGSIGKRSPDRWGLALCGECHRTDADSLHAVGELKFWHDIGVNPLRVCVQLYTQREDLVAMRAVIFTAVAERSA